MARLTYTNAAGQLATFELTKDVVVIGRVPECDVVIPKPNVSRQHAKIVKADGRWSVVDLGSTGGTFVNRIRVNEQALNSGDRLLIGDEPVGFDDGAKHPDVLGLLTELPVESGDLMRTVLGTRRMDVSQLVSRPDHSVARTVQLKTVRPDASTEPSVDDDASMRLDAEIAGHLLALVKIGDELRKCADVDAIAKASVEIAMKATGADRAALALGGENGEFSVRARAATRGDAEGMAPSKTFVEKMVSQKVALMALDTAGDAALSAAQSVVAQSIRSILCAPLWDGDAIRGWLYLDKVAGSGKFRKEDLDLVSAIGHYAAAEVARHKLTERRANLARFLSADIITHVESVGANLAAQEQLVTVFFSDIKGFTSMSEKLKPQGVKDLLDDYFERMTEILIDRHHGTLDKYIGDAIMALFGAPFSKGAAADAKACVAAAVEMRDALEVLRRENPLYAGFQIRIGINTGRMVAGLLGSKRRLEYSVIGDAVNIASRLESGGEPGKIQIGETTYELVKDAFVCELAGERALKNREKTVKSYWVTGKR